MVLKRIIDVTFAGLGLILCSPLLFVMCLLIWLQDFKSPIYVSTRIGLGGRPFSMFKLRSMTIDAQSDGIWSTPADDKRVTRLGAVIRRYKLDELPQLWNVVVGEMSLVGPRPNVPAETQLYTTEEKRVFSVLPGITDFASIIFSDEGEILRGSADPNNDYRTKIRPWKSRLALLYVDNRSLSLDLKLLCITLLNFLSRKQALIRVHKLVSGLNASELLKRVSLRQDELSSYPPP